MPTGPDPVDVAIGVLVERYSQTVDEASAMLCAMAVHDGSELALRAAQVIDGVCPVPVEDTGVWEPAYVRRAMAFIEGNAQAGATLVDMAAAAGVGVRALQHGFRRHRGQTPSGYLRAVRMAGAHGDLVAGDPAKGDTVGAIVARWKISNPGRFSMEYRQVYGCSPSRTLRS